MLSTSLQVPITQPPRLIWKISAMLGSFYNPSILLVMGCPLTCSISAAYMKVKARGPVNFRMLCVSSQMSAVIDLDKIYIPTVEAHTTPSAIERPFSYIGAIGPSTKPDYETIHPTGKLLEDEDATIVAAAAEAIALARAAVEVAKDAAQMIGHSSATKAERSEDLPSHANILQLEMTRLAEFEQASMVNNSMQTETEHREDYISHDQHKEESVSGLMDRELDLQQLHDSEIITGRSRRQSERRARRARAAEKAAISVKSGSSSKKKRSAVQEVDYSDPLRYLRATMSTSKLLTASEELELSEGIQHLIKLESLQEQLAERNGRPPTLAQWAAAAGMDPRNLRKHLNYGRYCKDKMIKSNIRLVISIAKNFQGAGMNLQDLVQEGCRGLVKGAEKFDASKGFKFSTYAHWWIKQAVRKSLSDQSRTIRLPFHMVEATFRVREAKKQLYSENGRYPDDEEIAEATGLTMKRLQAVNLTPKAPRSLEQKIGINQNLMPSEVIADPEALTTQEMLVKQLMKQDLNTVLDSLNPREKQVVRWRFGLEDGRMKTLQEIGELMGVSRERVRQIESCAFRKLKNKKRIMNLKQYLYS